MPVLINALVINIRQGRRTPAEFQSGAERLQIAAETSAQTSQLPDETPTGAISALIPEVTLNAWS